MKRYLHLLLTLLLLSVCTVGGAQTTYSHIFGKDTIKPTAGSKKFDNVTWAWTESKYIGYDRIKGVQIGSSNKVQSDAWTISTEGISGTITSVKVNACTGGSATLAVKVGDTDFTYNNKSSVSPTTTPTEYEFKGSASGTIAITMKASSKAMYIKSITVTSSTKNSAELSFSETTATATVGETFSAPTLNNPHNLTVSYSSSNTDVATVDASTGVVTTKAAGTTTITAESVETDTYDADKVSYTLTVNEKGTATIDLTRGYSNADDVTTVEGTGFTATFAAGTNTNNSPKYYTSGTAVRMYEGNTLTISSTTKNITKIEITFSGDGYSNLSLTNGQTGTYKSGTWTGSSKSIEFTNRSSQSRIQSIKVKLDTSDETTKTVTYTKATLTGFAKSGDDYYATFSSDAVTFFPNDVTVNGVVAENNQLTMTSGEEDLFTSGTVTIDDKEVKGYYVPANTGVLINAIDASVTYYTVANKTVDAIDNRFNMLYPASKAMSDLGDSYYFYKLAYDDYSAKTGLGFYWGADNGAAFTAKTNGAYLAVPKSSGSAKSGFRFDGTTTGVNTINAKTTTNDVIYNIQGQRVGASYKGLVIVNGKKMMRK